MPKVQKTYGDIAGRVPGYLGTWAPGYVGTRVPGYLGTQVPGYWGTLVPRYPGTGYFGVKCQDLILVPNS